MDIFEKFNSKFGKWYENFFGAEAGELRPKDVLRKIIAAMEDNRKEGLDSKIYVPNKYILELSVDDPEERDYLLSFLDEEELTGVLTKFMAQNGYHVRAPLDFTIAEQSPTEGVLKPEKLRVKVRFEKGAPSAAPAPAPKPTPPIAIQSDSDSDDMPTIAQVRPVEEDEPGTVPAIAWAALAITAPDGRKRSFSLTRPETTIGRSRNAGNEVILDSDGMVSKVHARIDREADGHFTLYDLGSTNGLSVGGVRIDGNRVLSDGDEIVIGSTSLVFQQASRAEEPAPPARSSSDTTPRARLTDDRGDAHVLASETLIGRSVTCDIVLNDPSVATRHARIIAPDRATYYLEDFGSDYGTKINGRRVLPETRSLLADGDLLTFGTVTLRFVGSPR